MNVDKQEKTSFLFLRGFVGLYPALALMMYIYISKFPHKQTKCTQKTATKPTVNPNAYTFDCI